MLWSCHAVCEEPLVPKEGACCRLLPQSRTWQSPLLPITSSCFGWHAVAPREAALGAALGCCRQPGERPWAELPGTNAQAEASWWSTVSFPRLAG